LQQSFRAFLAVLSFQPECRQAALPAAERMTPESEQDRPRFARSLQTSRRNPEKPPSANALAPMARPLDRLAGSVQRAIHYFRSEYNMAICIKEEVFPPNSLK
jgi:hypothetical protein